ncbi:LCP family protein [Lacticaseibacillus parakribbianus]|uniref:LCP family protein n=1 Tax=Lacticaseibacillus parakribbianus TaxID=2970927 RepID=UPI0021CB255D|nr:LCP family protein [Lacticaseibacillus parakribbianus]
MSRSNTPTPPHRRVVKLVLLVALTALALVGGYALRLYSQTKTAVDSTYVKTKETKKATVHLADRKPISILLMGTDTGAFGRTDTGRTDSMIVVTINPQKKRTTMYSIPRDTLVSVNTAMYSGFTKINAAYTFGKVDTAIKAVKDLIEVPINYYVLVNMAGLSKIVDAVGGIDVNVKFSWTDADAHGSFKKGPAHLNGTQALAYARMRHEDPLGDYGRQQRQQEVITQIVKKLLSTSSLTNYKSVMASLTTSMRTDLTFDEMVTIAENYRGAAGTIRKQILQGLGAYINGGSYQVPATADLQKVSDAARQELGLSPVVLNNYNTKQNAQNTAHGFNWKDQNNPTYTIYDTAQ